MTRMLCFVRIAVLFSSVFIVVGCGHNKKGTALGTGVGTVANYSLSSGVSFNIVTATSSTLDVGITFPTGTDDNTTAVITMPFSMAETITTYELWKDVYAWAIKHGYAFSREGVIGFSNMHDYGKNPDGTSSKFPGENSAGGNQQPVTCVTWRDAIVWCNALTEYSNASHGNITPLDCVYYSDSSYSIPLRTSTDTKVVTGAVAGTQDDPYIKANVVGNTEMIKCVAKGFRLPTGKEFEFCARYLGTTRCDILNAITRDAAVHANLTKGYYWTPGKYASGAKADCDNYAETSAVSYFEGAKKPFGFLVLKQLITGEMTTFPVKTKNSNALGLYDMSGNVMEYCFDWNTDDWNVDNSHRVTGGGACFSRIDSMAVGYMETINFPYTDGSGWTGFRVAKTQ